MDQILVSVCCPSQNEHIDIKKVANSHVVVTFERRQKRPKNSCSSSSSASYSSHLLCPGSFSGTTTDTSVSNIPPEPL